MSRLSVRAPFRKLGKRDHRDIIRNLKHKVKNNKSLCKKFEEYGVPLDEIDSVEVCFEDLPVSAKTKDMKIYLNKAMLDPDSDMDPAAYLSHELVHYLQQKTGNTEGHSATDDYLEKETEQEAFRVQIDYQESEEGQDSAEEYIDGLLDHHDIHDKEKRKELKKELKDES